MVLLIVDSHTKWIDAHLMTSINAQSTIGKLRETFATFGLPKVIITDNGPSFTSEEFKQFTEENGVVHRFTAPYHPSSNGLAERAVQTLKLGLKKVDGPLETRLSRFLFSYRTTPQTTTGVTPAELMFGRPLRTRLDMVFPNVSNTVEKNQARMENTRISSVRTFNDGELVLCRNYRRHADKWLPAKVLHRTGPLSYQVELTDGRVWRRHIDQLRTRSQEQAEPPISDVFDRNPESISVMEQPQLRRSTRSRRSPNRFNPCQ